MDNNSDKSYLLTSLDARNFKLINERFGHIVGDQTLMNIAKNIKSKFHKNGLYARSQSDSFLILSLIIITCQVFFYFYLPAF